MRTLYHNHSKQPGIYKITCTINKAFYVGSCKRFKERYRGHLGSLRRGTHHSKKMQNCFNKHGEASFVFEVLEVMSGSTELERQTREQWYLNTLWSKNILNVRKNTDKVKYRKPVSQEHREQARERALINPAMIATRFQKGHQGLKGEDNPMFGKPGPTKGKPLSEEHKRKIGEKNKQRMLALWADPAYAEKMSKAHLGKHSSPATEFQSGDQHPTAKLRLSVPPQEFRAKLLTLIGLSENQSDNSMPPSDTQRSS